MSDMIIAQVGGNWAALVSNTTPPIRWNFLGGTDVSLQYSALQSWAADMSQCQPGDGYAYMSGNMGNYFDLQGADSVTAFTDLFEATNQIIDATGALIFATATTVEASMDLAGVALVAFFP